MKIIVLGPSYENYAAASYQKAFLEQLRLKSEKYYHLSNIFNLSPEEIKEKAGFKPDIVLYNHGGLMISNINH